MTDPIIAAAEFIGRNLEWLRHHPACDEQLDTIEACARVVRGLVSGGGEKRYLGRCGAALTTTEEGCPVNCACHNGPHYACDEPGGCGSAGCGRTAGQACDGRVYGHIDSTTGTCRACGARHNQAERQQELNRQVADQLADTPLPAADIAHATRINVNTIRTWADRDKLSSYWWDGQRYVPWVDPPEGVKRHRLHYVADVVELERQRAERKAGRERRDTREAAA